MSQYTIYHNPRCSKSRQTLALLEAAGIEPAVVKYLETPLDAETLEALVDKLGITPRELLRKGEEEYKSLELARPDLSDRHLIDAMAVHPRLIERPIVVKGARAVLGRPPENVQELID